MCDGERIVEAALELWRQNPTAQEIVEANGWSNRNRPDWCGHFVGVVLRAVGVDAELCRRTLPSTARLIDRGPAGSRWADHGLERPAVLLHEMRPGDVICVVTGQNKSYGDHIAIVVDYDRRFGVVSTVEGNARGTLASGKTGRGVICRERNEADIRQILRIRP